ncbi:MAG: galactokinase family protein, partial [Bifidobacterium mongoliense]|nr:galactokinase family protein [Bifidobacterium mongoliense]
MNGANGSAADAAQSHAGDPVEFIEPLSSNEGVCRVQRQFADTYGEEPSGVWSAPGRVHLIGEHPEYTAGRCLPIALPHRPFLAGKPRHD